jgi:hypothetical protein
MTYAERLNAAKQTLELLRGTQCEECQYWHGSHALTCSRLTVDSLLLNYEGERFCNQHNLQASQIRDRRQTEQVTLWQGKFHALRHENNRLRAKVRKRQGVADIGERVEELERALDAVLMADDAITKCGKAHPVGDPACIFCVARAARAGVPLADAELCWLGFKDESEAK